jgi:subtilase family serine protease
MGRARVWAAAGLVAVAAVAVVPAGAGAASSAETALPWTTPSAPTSSGGAASTTRGTSTAPGYIAVDPHRADGQVHHPLLVKVQGTMVDPLDTVADPIPLVTSATPIGYTPAQMKAYLGLTGTGTGQTVAIVSAYHSATVKADLTTFDSAFALPAPPTFKQVSQTGSTTVFPVANETWALETALDVQWVHAIAPGAGILLVEATTSSITNLNTAIAYAAKQTGVTVISNSWGTSEYSTEASSDTYCKLATALCVVSSGDNGNPGLYPAYNPWVLAVGGTTMSLTSTNTVLSEKAWSGSGGGISLYESRPAYQSTVNTQAKRSIPDVSYNGDPNTGFAVYTSTPYGGQTGWMQVGGTSAGAPQWAGIIAVSNQIRKAAGKTILSAYNSKTLTSPGLTAIYKVTSGLADVTTGTNGACGASCTAGTDFDFVTGRGSPRVGIDVALKAQP